MSMVIASLFFLWMTGLRINAFTLTSPTSRFSRLCNSFVDSLDYNDALNTASADRTSKLNDFISKRKIEPVDKVLAHHDDEYLTVENPGLTESMRPVASGTWRVIYAPHMAFFVRLLGGDGTLTVEYILDDDGTIQSHATFSGFEQMRSIILSVSGTYGSVSATTCRVEWDKTWIRLVDDDTTIEPFERLEDVPDSWSKEIINRVGKLLFIRPFSVFPISFLNNELIVFDFELINTRICARKITS